VFGLVAGKVTAEHSSHEVVGSPVVRPNRQVRACDDTSDAIPLVAVLDPAEDFALPGELAEFGLNGVLPVDDILRCAWAEVEVQRLGSDKGPYIAAYLT